MATFQKVKLGTLLENKYILAIQDGNHGDIHPAASDYIVDGDKIPFIMANNIRENRVDLENCKFISKKLADNLRIGFAISGDVLITHKGTVGEVAIVPKTKYPYIMLTPQVTYYRVDRDRLNPQFLSSYFRSHKFQSKLKNFNAQSTRAYLGITAQKELEIELPDLQTQTRIASVLSAYDELIENNEKRIKALEEMAQLLYTEWFVKFKFPGHEKVQMIDSGTQFGLIPEGWKVGEISNLVDVISGFPFRGSTYQKSGKYKIVTIKNVHDGEFVLNFDSFIDQLPAKLPATCILKRGDILLSLTGNVGRICLVYGTNHVLNQRVAKLDPVNTNKREYVYLLLSQKRFQQKLEAISNGAAQQNLSPIQIKGIRVIIPSSEILDQYSQLASKYFDLSVFLQEKNESLAKIRDLLIPQLVTGKRGIQ